MPEWILKLVKDFNTAFVVDNRWKYITDGLLVTLQVAFFAALFGIIIGFVIAIIRSTYDKNFKYQ